MEPEVPEEPVSITPIITIVQQELKKVGTEIDHPQSDAQLEELNRQARRLQTTLEELQRLRREHIGKEEF